MDEIVLLFDFTNNDYQFHLFYNHFLTLSSNTTITGEFLCWLYKCYRSWSWVELKNGKSEGAIQHQITKTHPILVLSLNKSLGSFLHDVDGMDVKEANLTNYRKIMQSQWMIWLRTQGIYWIKSQLVLLLQAMVRPPVVTGWNITFLAVPIISVASRNPPVYFTNTEQVMQLVHCLALLGD